MWRFLNRIFVTIGLRIYAILALLFGWPFLSFPNLHVCNMSFFASMASRR